MENLTKERVIILKKAQEDLEFKNIFKKETQLLFIMIDFNI